MAYRMWRQVLPLACGILEAFPWKKKIPQQTLNPVMSYKRKTKHDQSITFSHSRKHMWLIKHLVNKVIDVTLERQKCFPPWLPPWNLPWPSHKQIRLHPLHPLGPTPLVMVLVMMNFMVGSKVAWKTRESTLLLEMEQSSQLAVLIPCFQSVSKAQIKWVFGLHTNNKNEDFHIYYLLHVFQ